METKQTPSQKWRKEQRDAGRIPRLTWLDNEEWAIVKALIAKLKKLRNIGN